MNGGKSSLQQKKVFLLASSNSSWLKWVADKITSHVTDPTIFEAHDGMTAMAKFHNMPPHLFLIDVAGELPKLSGARLLEQSLTSREGPATAFILSGRPPEVEHHLDQIVTGQIQYWTRMEDEAEFTACLVKGLNYSSDQERTSFHVRFLAKGDILVREGEKADFVYFVTKGHLQATKCNSGADVVLGNIEVGEFVGEMAYVNGEPRVAQVRALSDCELIEVPIGHFDKVLYTRPSWSKALMVTLSKRLKRSNEAKSK